MNIEAGSDFRKNVNFKSNDIWKFYQALYTNPSFPYHYRLTKEMVSSLYRDTTNGQLRNFYLKLTKNCHSVEDYKSIEVLDTELIYLFLSKKFTAII